MLKNKKRKWLVKEISRQLYWIIKTGKGEIIAERVEIIEKLSEKEKEWFKKRIKEIAKH